MVNPLTGDFSYSMDVLEVPGPDGGFTLPLSYSGGIKTEQQASWVGLGWSMNAGAIARSMIQFPDDANGQHHVTQFKNEGVRGWSSKIPGVYQMGWDSEAGHWGDISILRNLSVSSISWDKSGATFETLGVSFSGSGVKFSATEAFMDIMKAASMASGIVAGPTASLAMNGIIAQGQSLAIGIATDAITTRNLKSSLSGFGEPTTKVQKRFLHRNYWIFVNENRVEEMYGSLYFQNTPTLSTHEAVNNGPVVQGKSTGKATAFNSSFTGNDNGKSYFDVASDMHLALEEEQDYSNAMTPISIAHDYFSVMGQGVSGSIKPMRLEVGSLSYPKQMSEGHYKYNVLPYSNYKPQFRYEGALGNTYTHHKGTISSPYAGISADWANYTVKLDDPIFKDELKRIEAKRHGLKDNRLAQGKHIEWFTNEEIGASYPNSPIDKGLLLEFREPESFKETKEVISGYTKICPEGAECEVNPIYSGTVTVTHRNKFRSSLPEKGIGGFAITSEDGTTYHYTLPVYQYVQYARVQEKGNTNNYSAEKYGSSYDHKKTGYATAWLLTAITGPDFVDRGPAGTGNGFIDEHDWGRWVKFEYGKFSGNYKWRMPYSGYTVPDEAAEAQSYTEGFKETYYLNSISTRTHTALFIKNVRQDGRGHYTLSNVPNPNLGINESHPSSSLKLDEVVLLNNDDLRRLQTAGGIGADVPALTANMSNNAANDAGLLRNGDSFREVLDVYDVTSHAAIRSFLSERALKRLVFNYTYELSPGTTNSFSSAVSPPSFNNLTEGRSGKLTLRSLAVYGTMSTKLTPDFIFEYGNNPTYHPDRWDGYGLYNRYGTPDLNSHKPAIFSPGYNTIADQDAAAWSLTKIVTPLGGSMEVAYERDTYAYVSEYGSQPIKFTLNGTENRLSTTYAADMQNHLKVGDIIKAEVWFNEQFICRNVYSEDCGNGPCYEDQPKSQNQKVTATLTVASVGAKYIDVTGIPSSPPADELDGCDYEGSTITQVDVFIPRELNGGDLRVREITVSDDQNNKYRSRYDYSTTTANGSRITSGVIAQEPDFVDGYKHSFYDYFDYPVTSVMYGQVTVYKGRLKTGTDFSEKTEFYFNTPHSGMLAIAKDTHSAYYRKQQPLNKDIAFAAIHHRLEVNTSQIGQLQAVKRYNSSGMLEQSTELTYGSVVNNSSGIAQQGIFSEGALLAEMVKNKKYDHYKYKLIRTTKTYMPSVVSSIKTTASGIVSTETNREWDFYTGEVLKKRQTNSLGQVLETEEVPAYHITQYAAMGSKADNPANKNMLTQKAASSVYKITGTEPEVKKLLAAGVQAWKGDWLAPREYNTATNTFVSGPVPSAVWRKHASYTWKTTALEADGTIQDFVAFDWAREEQQAKWVSAGATTQYTRSSKPLQVKDINGNYHATKYGYGEAQVIASASNARYTEIAYSGAEDPVYTGGTTLFGGEVRGGQGQLSSEFKHTGRYSLQVGAGGQGFTYKATAGDPEEAETELEAGRKYRASVWVHASALSSGEGLLYASLPDGSLNKEISTANSEVLRRAGDWHLLDMVLQLPEASIGKQLTVGCKSVSGTLYFDDFRFHPLDAPMTTSVYDESTGQQTHVLDNNNLYTRYDYDDGGKLIATYRETLASSVSERKVSASTYFYARMADPIWLRTGLTECVEGNNGYTGIARVQYRDVNTSSPTYNNLKWDNGQYSASCPTCDPLYQKWLNGSCETGTQVFGPSIYKGNGQYECSYSYQFSDGSRSESTTQLSMGPCQEQALQ